MQKDKEVRAKPNLEERIMCIHQFQRSKVHIFLPDRGNCMKCEYDPENNRHCGGYSPLTVYCFTVKPRDSEQD